MMSSWSWKLSGHRNAQQQQRDDPDASTDEVLLAGISDEEKAKELQDIPKPVLQVIEKLMDQGKTDAQVAVGLIFPLPPHAQAHAREAH